MSNEFYEYIARNTLNFFQLNMDSMRPGARYCLKLDNEEMVSGVDTALREQTAHNGIQGSYTYSDVYSTFTIKLGDQTEIVVASKINGMTDDFLATLRNAELTEKHFPILMVTHSTIDTITSGTGDLAAKGMPFHAQSIIKRIKADIEKAQLSVADKSLLELQLCNKQNDRYSDKSSLFEYSELLAVLGRGYVQDSDYPLFGLLPDPVISNWQDSKKIKERLSENFALFEKIDRVYKHGNITEELSNEYDRSFVELVDTRKKNGTAWYVDQTYAGLKTSQEKLKNRHANPLQITDNDITAYSGSPIEYSFTLDQNMFVRNDGITKSKQHKKNILIFNPDCKDEVTLSVLTNTHVKQDWIECIGAGCIISSKGILISIKSSGCDFVLLKIQDTTNSIKYELKICVVNVLPCYLENIQTSYLLTVKKSMSRNKIQILGMDNELIINPGHDKIVEKEVKQSGAYECTYDGTLKLKIISDNIESDTGNLDLTLKIGSVIIPLEIQDEKVKPIELTGVGAFKWKFQNEKSLEYREGNKIVCGTSEYFAKERFKASLSQESLFVKNGWCAVVETVNGYESFPLSIPEAIQQAYNILLNEYRQLRTLPSLAYYEKSSPLYLAAVNYVAAVQKELFKVSPGQTLSQQINDILLLGCVIKNHDESAIAMSPLQPLNIAYQLNLLNEKAVGDIRENLVEKLTALYLLPFIMGPERNLYHAIEQRHSPEWRYYAPIRNKRFQGARNFVQTLVYNKIVQYKEHFSFLFDDIDNDLMCINLINMGDCNEVFNGIIRYYNKCLKDNLEPDKMLQFAINIYVGQDTYNAFTLLSNLKKLKDHIRATCGTKEIDDENELAVILTGKVHCYFRSPEEKEYQYAHLTFYEMESKVDSGASRMDSITTGVSLGGITSGVPSVLISDWYKTGFGTKYAKKTELLNLAQRYNALFRVAFSGSSFEPDSSIFTEIEQDQKGQLGKIYRSSNWVVFVDPKVDLSFFQRGESDTDNLMIIHYSDQYTSASGYDDITVTQKSDQYNKIISEHLHKKGVFADGKNITDIINLFNAVNGSWMLRLIAAKKQSGAADSYFSREKMSILSAIKLCMAYYSHPDIVWVPISLEEMLRVSGGAGLSQKEGLLSAKNLGFEQRATSDDILLVGLEGPQDNIKIYLHPVEVKIGLNPSNVINKAKVQVRNTYEGLWQSLWPEQNRDDIERKVSRNFFIQLVLVCCEKMKLYDVYPEESWDLVLSDFRENLLNENYIFSKSMDRFIGRGTVISFGSSVLCKSGVIDESEVCLLEIPESLGANYMVMPPQMIEDDLIADLKLLPERLKKLYAPASETTEQPEALQPAETDQIRCNPVEPITEKPSVKITAPKSTEVIQEKDLCTSGESENAHGIQVLFGTDVSTGAKLYWHPNDTNQVFHTNTGIIGTMGTGKTQFTKSMITQIYRARKDNFGSDQVGILIFDYKGDYNESKEDFVEATNATIYKPYHLPFNPLALTKSRVFKPLLPIHTANAFKDTLTKVYGLGPKQQNTLFQCIIDAYAAKGIIAGDPNTWDNTAPTFNMVYSLYSNNEDIKKNDSLAAAMDKLYQFEIFEPDPLKTRSLYDLLNGVVVIDLSGYDPDIQSLLVAITLDLFYSQMQAAGSSKLDNKYRQITKLILVDEADNFMSEGFPTLKKILKEGREFGVGTILSTQFLRHFGSGDDDYSKYILTWVVHNVSDLKSSDVEFVFKTEAKSMDAQNLYNDIKSLAKHHSIIKIGNDKPRYIEDKAFWELFSEIKG